MGDSGTLVFEVGDNAQCHIVELVNDNICERPELEDFTSSLELLVGMQIIIVDPDLATVIIDDSDDCRKCFFVVKRLT